MNQLEYREIKLDELRFDKSLGYYYFIDKSHPLVSNSSGYVWFHRHLVSMKLGRWLSSKEHVHHLDENKKNNELDNLIVVSRNEHASLHNGKRREIKCKICQKTTKNVSTCSVKCMGLLSRKVKRPSDIELRIMLKDRSIASIAREYGVSWNAVKKWTKF